MFLMIYHNRLLLKEHSSKILEPCDIIKYYEVFVVVTQISDINRTIVLSRRRDGCRVVVSQRFVVEKLLCFVFLSGCIGTFAVPVCSPDASLC